MTKVLLITSCSDQMYWYRGLEGAYVPFVRQHSDVFMSREPAGYTNIVNNMDAVLVELDQQPVFYDPCVTSQV